MTIKFKEAIERSRDKKLGIVVLQLEDAEELEETIGELVDALKNIEWHLRDDNWSEIRIYTLEVIQKYKAGVLTSRRESSASDAAEKNTKNNT